MKRLMIIGLLAVLGAVGVGAVAPAAAQERNASRLVLEDTTYVDVSMGVAAAAGELHDVFEPLRQLGGTLDASSRRKLGDVSLYGHFGYGYGHAQGSTWRGWIDPYETPFMLADSVPGNLSLEQYAMEAGIGVPVGNGWSVGVNAAYDVTLMAKHKDLRNKNTAMAFRIAPGVNWHGDVLGLGLDLGYERSTERVEYTQVSESKENMLFDIYGLWLYHASGFASAENRRMKERNRLFGDFQFEVDAGPVQVHNNFRALWERSVQTEVGYNNLQFGEVDAWTWSDDLSLSLGEAHRVEASAAFSTMQGLRPLQRQELDPDSRIRVWVTYGDPVFCYWRRYHVEQLKYTVGKTWKLAVDLKNWGMEHSYTEYPHRFEQRINHMEASLSLEIPAGPLKLVPWTGFTHAYDSYTDDTPWQLSGPLRAQWDIWDGDNIFGAMDVRWSSASGRCYVNAHYIMGGVLGPDDHRFRQMASLTLGFVF